MSDHLQNLPRVLAPLTPLEDIAALARLRPTLFGGSRRVLVRPNGRRLWRRKHWASIAACVAAAEPGDRLALDLRLTSFYAVVRVERYALELAEKLDSYAEATDDGGAIVVCAAAMKARTARGVGWRASDGGRVVLSGECLRGASDRIERRRDEIRWLCAGVYDASLALAEER